MSHEVYLDARHSQMLQLNNIISQAMGQLGAVRSQISCGAAEVHTSNVDAQEASRVFGEARLRDCIETPDTAGLTSQLSATSADYSATALGDWQPVPGADVVHVEGSCVEGATNTRLVEDLEVAAFDGARMMIFETQDGLGNTSYKIGLDTSLFDDQGNWKVDTHKKAYDSFIQQAVASQLALAAEKKQQAPVSVAVSSAMGAAGLLAASKQKVGSGSATHTIFTNAPQTQVAPPKTMVGGGGN